MAFGFGGVPAGGAGGVTQGNDLEVIQTEGLGFLSIAGDAKVQLIPKWSPPPAPTASLLGIASRKGLVAAAGPEAVYIATTESVRKAFEGEKNGDSEIRSFTPQATVPFPIRISQLAFTADEKYLVLSAETGGGLAVYDVQTLTQGGTQPAFELSTNQETLRALIPNPMPESAGLCAVVTNNGNLFMANLVERQLVSGSNGPTLLSQVSCAAWSTKGKQLVAGMADGSIVQMTPEGVEKARIPKPPNVGNFHVASIAWLENHVFLVVHNATNGQEPAIFHLVTRQQPPGGNPSFTFQKLTDPVEPFVSDKAPHHTLLRLRDFPPNLQDLLLVSSTAHEGIGLLSKSKTPLTTDKPANSVTNVFTTTELADDSKRAQLPMGEDLTETYPVGSAIDLSSKDKVYKPIPTDEIELSPGPLPGLWVLNNEGVLASWWIVYNESIRGGTTYPGIGGGEMAAPAFASPAPAATTPSAFATPAPTKAPAFGSPSAFGGPSALGAKTSPWSGGAGTASAAPAFGSSAFGSKPAAAAPSGPTFGSSTFGSRPAAPAFGQASGMSLGSKVSPWSSGTTSSAGPAFGQSSLAPTGNKVFGGGNSAAASGGFAGFASKGGFGGLGGAPSGSSIFGSKPGAPLTSSTPDVSMDTDTAFPPPAAKTDKPALGSSPFVLGTTFKADKFSADDNEKPKEGASKSNLFGSGFGLSLDDAAKKPPAAESKDMDMESTTPPPEEKPKPVFGTESTTPTTTPAPQRVDFRSAASTGGSNLFGSKLPTPGGMSNIFGAPRPATTSIFGTPKAKQETENKVDLSKIPEAPLPPDATSKAAFDLSFSSSESEYSPPIVSKPSAKAEDAPLPPDFLGQPVKKPEAVPEAAPLPPDSVFAKPKPEPTVTTPTVPSDAPLPPDFLAKPPTKPAPSLPTVPDSASDEGLSEGHSEGEEEEEEGEGEEGEEGDEGEEGEYESEAGSEGSGVDVAKDLSPTIGFSAQTPGVTPQSSFGGMGGSTFSAISRTEADPSRPLFGEIGRNAPPLFPKPTIPPSPRSPSPVRGPPRSNLLRPSEPGRSFSAPGVATQLLGRKAAPLQSSPVYSPGQRAPVDPNVQAQRKLVEKMRAAEEVVVDPQDEGIQQILQSKLEPTLQMNELFTVQSKLEPPKPGRDEVPGAVESLWKDINRMIDVLGLNSRSLQSFILGHTTKFKQGGRTNQDLDNPDDWVLVEANELGAVLDAEVARCVKGRIQDVQATEDAIKDFAKDLAKLRAKEEDMRKVINTHIDPDQLVVAKSLPLSAEQATQQTELRRSYATFSQLLAEAEEALTMLRTRIASASGASGKGPVPTVEAIIRTINKMTSMAEKRSGDVDVLESQMRRLRLGSVGPGSNGSGGTPGPRSREGSPFATPQKTQRRSLLMSSPEKDGGPGGFGSSRLRESFASSVTSYARGGSIGFGTPSPRKKMSMYSEEEKRELKGREVKRKNALQMLRNSLAKTGPNVSRLRDDE